MADPCQAEAQAYGEKALTLKTAQDKTRACALDLKCPFNDLKTSVNQRNLALEEAKAAEGVLKQCAILNTPAK